MKTLNHTPKVKESLRQYVELVELDLKYSDVTMSQLLRILSAPEVNSEYIITSDIDMLPLSVTPFSRSINFLSDPESQLLVMRDVLKPGQYPICYNIATPEVWKKLFMNSFNSINIPEILTVLEMEHGNLLGNWFFDQEFIYQLFTTQSEIEILTSSEAITGLRRLDRARHKFPLNWILLPAVRKGKFSEYHSARKSVMTSLYIYCLLKVIRFGK